MKSKLYVNCPLCGSDNYKIKFKNTKSSFNGKAIGHFCCTNPYLSEHGDIVECIECSMHYSNPQIDSEELLTIYKQIKDPLYLREKKAREYTFKDSLNQLHRFIKSPGTILDIGCYTGIFMEVSAAEGWNVCGFELSSWAASIARELKIGRVFEGTLDQIPLLSQSIDVITLWDVIEHISQPSVILANISNLLRPGGILALSTHVVDSKAVRFFGKSYPFFMDMHLVHFSRNTIKKMLSKHGFEVLSIIHHRRTIRLGYVLEKIAPKIPLIGSIIKWMSNIKWLANRSIKIGFLGLVNVFARKNY